MLAAEYVARTRPTSSDAGPSAWVSEAASTCRNAATTSSGSCDCPAFGSTRWRTRRSYEIHWAIGERRLFHGRHTHARAAW